MVALSRNIQAATLQALSKSVIYPIVLVYLDWPDGAVRAHSNAGQLSYDGFQWNGVGEFGSLQMPEEEMGLASQPAELRLIGVPEEIDQYLEDDIRDREGIIYFGAVTERNGNVLVGEPFEIFTGYMDAFRERSQVEDGTLRRDVILQLAPGPSQRAFAEVFHTYEDQIRRFPGDTAGRLTLFAEAEADKFTWPQ